MVSEVKIIILSVLSTNWRTCNFNALAWEAPRIANNDNEDDFGYLPEHEYYPAIANWLKSGEKLYSTRTGNTTVSRVHWPNEPQRWHAVAKFNHQSNMINWVFREPVGYEVG